MGERERDEMEGLSKKVQRLLVDKSFLCAIGDVPPDKGIEDVEGLLCTVSVHGRRDTIVCILARTMAQLDISILELGMEILRGAIEDDITGGPVVERDVSLPLEGDVRPHVRVMKNGKVIAVRGYNRKKGGR
jgi:hypothetical protein